MNKPSEQRSLNGAQNSFRLSELSPEQITEIYDSFHIEDDRTGLSSETLQRAIADNLYYIQGKFPEIATLYDYYMAVAYTVRDRLLHRWINTVKTYREQDVKVVCYLSAEYLPGPHLENNLVNLGIYDQVQQAVESSGLDLRSILAQEEEPGLGNGGLGRLAACYMDSLATLEIPAIGYGIRYEYGIFDQEIREGWQVEITDKWLRLGNPWEIPRPENAVEVKFGGYTEPYTDDQGDYRVRWIPHQVVNGIPFDTPISGYRVNTTSTMRLWKAEAPESFDFQAFNVGDYYGAVDAKIISENLTKVLYPNDEPIQGKQLRLEQQYFFVSCSLQNLLKIHLLRGDPIETFYEKFVIQLNDTHPAIGVAELMRLLVDEYLLHWQKAWDITQQAFAYTNHTLLPEALETWPLNLFGRLLPRHLEIIYEINQRFLDQVRLKYLGNPDKLARLSLIEEGGSKRIRMAHLACVGSHAINGVAALHTELLKKGVLKDFYDLWPHKFTNITNGVTPRRWMVLINPRLTQLITREIGETWITQLEDLKRLESLAEDPAFRQEWRRVKRAVKQDLADYIQAHQGLTLNPDSIFDIQAKRIHEYKRQHLNVLHIITLYNRIKHNPQLAVPPRTFIFGGKAAPGYRMAKLIIKLITAVGEVVNYDPDICDRIKVVFLPDFNVTNSQRIYPAADLSEQISTAGKEASGTGNMKFSMNGALTIGTLDGANIEIREAVGADNFFLFGHTTEDIVDLKEQGYVPKTFYNTNPALKEAIDLIASGYFSHGNRALFQPLVDQLLQADPYCLLADYQSYIDCQDQVGQAFQDQDTWTKTAILNVARIGRFSSDRAIREYGREIWQVDPVSIHLEEYQQAKASLAGEHCLDADACPF
ncbi:glycogen/starch/alpha-glucan phosphorylase [Acaryochloris sp. IP29b_bin.137]|uniref:glycogen/starch/alpha-glucan phosphorylase n=1 Tax=Acaryochloris sp. IP29b_bin.137 TaxID=2969217 RepID=UPI0026301080|nr:glycogen/starch/alpha-glucan phosphorylase [Acaryochloris sp. IP29b_bin.137]